MCFCGVVAALSAAAFVERSERAYCRVDKRVAAWARPLEAHNLPAAATSRIDTLQATAPTGNDLTGEDILIGIWDEASARVTHVDLHDRAVSMDAASVANHSTHVAGTLIGSGLGQAAARGMAPQAQLLSYDWNLDVAELRERAPYLSVSTHAYGYRMGWAQNPGCDDLPSWMGRGSEREDRAFGKYGAEARAIDQLVADTDLPMVWSAGNERLDVGASGGDPHYHFPDCATSHTDEHDAEAELQYDTMGLQLAAKNAIVVGAVAHVVSHPPAPGEISVMPFSSFGPMDDGRIKPDLVASGALIYSTVASADDAYGSFSGTSSSAAVVAGAIALLTEHSRDVLGGVDLSADAMKALLIHSAVSANGDGSPDYAAGYGLLDARAAADLLSAHGALPEGEAQIIRASLQSGDEAVELETSVVAAGTALRVTLAWIDPPAAENRSGLDDATPALVNDLDLVLVAPDATEHRPWSLDRLSPDAQATNMAANQVDNVEVVDVAAAANAWSGAWTIRVSSAGPLFRLRPQRFALVSSAALALEQPVLAAPRSIFVKASPGVTPDPKAVALRLDGASGSLAVTATESAPWLSLASRTVNAPGSLTLMFDTTGLPVGDHFATIALAHDNALGPHTVGVVLRVECEADCTGRVCGADPVCGELCGGCAAGETCDAGGQCVGWGASCPAADLGSEVAALVALGTTQGAGDDSTGTCGEAGGEDVAFAWTAPQAGTYRFGTDGSALDTVLYARDACDGAELACSDHSDDAAGAFALTLTQGQSVIVVVDSERAVSSGEFHLGIQHALCSDADLGSALGESVMRGSTVGAVDRYAGTCTGAGERDAVFTWTARDDADYSFSVEGSAAAHSVYVRAGDCGGAELGCATSSAATISDLTLARGDRVSIVIEAQGDGAEFALGIASSIGQCAGNCEGSPNDGACSCDAACVQLGDCCADACELCGHCCAPQCEGKMCGADGCGGQCGECEPGAICDLGLCVPDACADQENGAECDDGDGCTRDDRCIGGRCGGLAVICDDGDACTVERCDAELGECTTSTSPGCCEDDADCEDGDDCTLDSCVDTRCESIEDTSCETPLAPPTYSISDGGDADVDGGMEPSGERGDCGCEAVGARAKHSSSGIGMLAMVFSVLLVLRSRVRPRESIASLSLLSALLLLGCESDSSEEPERMVEPEPDSPSDHNDEASTPNETPDASASQRDSGIDEDDVDAGVEMVAACGPAGECELLDSQSCGADETCVVSEADGELEAICIEAGSGRDGDACESSADCGSGLDCTSFDGSGTCRRYCCELNLTAGCPGGQYCRVALAEMSDPTGVALCDRCDGCALLEDECGDGLGCYPLDAECTACLAEGDAALDAPCTNANDCAKGSACYRTSTTGQPICVAFCDLTSGAACRGEFACREVTGAKLPAGLGLCL